MKHTFTYLLFFVLITIGKTWGQNANTDIYDSQKVQEIAITFPEKNWKSLLDSPMSRRTMENSSTVRSRSRVPIP
jgi:hypothetical protein